MNLTGTQAKVLFAQGNTPTTSCTPEPSTNLDPDACIFGTHDNSPCREIGPRLHVFTENPFDLEDTASYYLRHGESDALLDTDWSTYSCQQHYFEPTDFHEHLRIHCIPIVLQSFTLTL
jgi:hypothetical protein